MNKTEKFLVVDVEGNSTEKLYDFGCLVADKNGTIYGRYSLALQENYFDNLKNCINAKEMTHKNIEFMLQDIEQKFYKVISNNDFEKFLINLIKKHNIKRVFAYNVAFDKNAIQRTISKNAFMWIENKVEFCDIWQCVLLTKLKTKKYIKFCLKNNFVSDKGNIKTSAEIVYRYLFNDIEFVENHTGLADTLIEYKILLECFKTKKRMFFKSNENKIVWKHLMDFAKEKKYI